jgi:hypothetical protein
MKHAARIECTETASPLLAYRAPRKAPAASLSSSLINTSLCVPRPFAVAGTWLAISAFMKTASARARHQLMAASLAGKFGRPRTQT